MGSGGIPKAARASSVRFWSSVLLRIDAYLLTLARRNRAIFGTFDTKLEGLADPETRIRVLT
jgi:hypothetical protein